MHLGYDLAVTPHVGVQASNDGKIIYAAPLGIYGNCIVLDPGYGMQTIDGHLSRINVHEGDLVKRGEVMGLSGVTGMAGGDHIHYRSNWTACRSIRGGLGSAQDSGSHYKEGGVAVALYCSRKSSNKMD